MLAPPGGVSGMSGARFPPGPGCDVDEDAGYDADDEDDADKDADEDDEEEESRRRGMLSGFVLLLLKMMMLSRILDSGVDY